jgi:hypothetical protein
VARSGETVGIGSRTIHPRELWRQLAEGDWSAICWHRVVSAAPQPGEFAATAKKEAAMAGKAVHTVPHGDGWANMRDGGKRVAKVFRTKEQAQAAGRETARREHVEHLVHNSDNKIGERNSYGPDRRDRRG